MSIAVNLGLYQILMHTYQYVNLKLFLLNLFVLSVDSRKKRRLLTVVRIFLCDTVVKFNPTGICMSKGGVLLCYVTAGHFK